jgi:hypothetical protein
MSISPIVNGMVHNVDVEPETPLLRLLRDSLKLKVPNTVAALHSAALPPSLSTVGRRGHAASLCRRHELIEELERHHHEEKP